MIGQMDERITIQKSTVTVDQYSNHVKSWMDYFTCWAYASTYQKDESPDVVTTDQRGVTFTVRYCSELAPITSTDFRVMFRSNIYDIQSIDMMNYQRKTLKLKCRKVER